MHLGLEQSHRQTTKYNKEIKYALAVPYQRQTWQDRKYFKKKKKKYCEN